MNKMRIFHLSLFIFLTHVKGELKDSSENKNVLPYFRRKAEELEDADFFQPTESGDPHNLVSFMVKNVREIFDEEEDSDIAFETNDSPVITTKNLKTSKRLTMTRVFDYSYPGANISSSTLSTSTFKKDLMIFENLPYTTLLDKNHESKPKIEKPMLNTRNQLQRRHHRVKQLKSNPKSDKNGRDSIRSSTILPYHIGKTGRRADVSTSTSEQDSDVDELRRSCIMCNNVDSEDCNSPKNKLISSAVCEHDDDLCYSLHTPFGIVERGCFNVNHNLSIYVCSCNLCNYISISEMPYLFNEKRNWVNNVIELSRTRHFRRSVFKDMSCLTCEVNTTTKIGDMLENANCLEGNIGNLPFQECNVDEICGVKALRADGYIWRGCIKAPLYNYWWAICDQDLCNYDSIVSLYDFIGD